MLAQGNSLAGSTTALMAAALRLLNRNVPLPEVVAVTSATAANVFGLRGHALRPGDPADLIELHFPDGVAEVARVARRGVWLDPVDVPTFKEELS